MVATAALGPSSDEEGIRRGDKVTGSVRTSAGLGEKLHMAETAEKKMWS